MSRAAAIAKALSDQADKDRRRPAYEQQKMDIGEAIRSQFKAKTLKIDQRDVDVDEAATRRESRMDQGLDQGARGFPVEPPLSREENGKLMDNILRQRMGIISEDEI